MPNLWIALNLYQEEHLLPECLDSIRKYNPEAKIVAVDGAYQSFINENKKLIGIEISFGHRHVVDQMERFIIPDSKDKTLQILKDYNVDRIIECEKDEKGDPKPWASECVKRSKYFVGEPGDVYLVIDGDERLTQRLDWEKLTEPCYNFVICRDGQGSIPYQVMRIFHHHDGMKYEGAHHALWIDGQMWRREMCQTLDFKVFHRVEYRAVKDPLRHLAKGAYYRYLTNTEEAVFRKVNSL